jgi:hypothetical protein
MWITEKGLSTRKIVKTYYRQRFIRQQRVKYVLSQLYLSMSTLQSLVILSHTGFNFPKIKCQKEKIRKVPFAIIGKVQVE